MRVHKWVVRGDMCKTCFGPVHAFALQSHARPKVKHGIFKTDMEISAYNEIMCACSRVPALPQIVASNRRALTICMVSRNCL